MAVDERRDGASFLQQVLLMSATSEFDVLDELSSTGVDAALAQLAEQFRSQNRFHELFDVRLMQARHRLGLPAAQPVSIEDLPEPTRTQVENAYLSACREVGNLLLDEGKIGEAWRYLRPLGENAVVAAKLEAIAPNDDNTQEIIDVALREGVHPLLGFRVVLENYGTCNAITTFDAEMYRRSREQQQQAAAMLLRHLHKELLSNVRYDIKRQEGTDAPEQSLADLVEPRDWLFLNNNYHIDTTHLTSVVRFARILEDRELVKLAYDLTEYGRRLGSQYHFDGEEPFTDNYLHHGYFFGAQLGHGVEEALAYFRDRAENVNSDYHGTTAAEVYIVLLSRLGRHHDALSEAMRLLPDARQLHFAPNLLELAGKAGDYERLLQLYRDRNDLLGYAAALIERSKKL